MGGGSPYHIRMGPLSLAREVPRYNRQQRLRAGFYGISSVLLWLLSAGTLALLIFLPLMLFGLHPPLWSVILGTAAGLAVLVHDGLGYSRRLFDVDDYRLSIYAFNPFGSDQARIEGLIMAGVAPSVPAAIVSELSLAYLISQALFCAPRFTVIALKAVRSQVQITAAQQDVAQRFLDHVLDHGGPWTLVSEHREAMAVMSDLELMGITESRVDDGRVQVRIVPEVRRAHQRTASSPVASA